MKYLIILRRGCRRKKNPFGKLLLMVCDDVRSSASKDGIFSLEEGPQKLERSDDIKFFISK